MLLAGEAAALYYNRAISPAGLHHSHNLAAKYGFDGWKEPRDAALGPTALWKSDTVDWWSTRIQARAHNPQHLVPITLA